MYKWHREKIVSRYCTPGAQLWNFSDSTVTAHNMILSNTCIRGSCNLFKLTICHFTLRTGGESKPVFCLLAHILTHQHFLHFTAFLPKHCAGIKDQAKKCVIAVACTLTTTRKADAQASQGKQHFWDSTSANSEIQRLQFRYTDKPLAPFKWTLCFWNANCKKLLIFNFIRYTASGVYGLELLPESPRSFGLGAKPVSTNLVGLLWIHKDPIFLWFKAFRQIFRDFYFIYS